jgi:hypothetical protein
MLIPVTSAIIQSFEGGRELVISFSSRGRSFFGAYLFCLFMDFTIYVIGINSIRVVVLTRNHKFDFGFKPSLFGN